MPYKQKLFFIIPVLFLLTGQTYAQLSRRVLFLGNSYTGVNNLPQLVYDVAISAGDTLYFDSNSPGGYKLVDHAQDATSQNKISAGNWDYVIIQGQSQEPVVAQSQFNSGGNMLHSQVKQSDPCATVMLYMTWGRKNGDASTCPWFPEMCTYEGMDSTLRKHYLELTSSLNAEVSPVSVVWHNLRMNNPGIELYQADESHPSLEGSYAAACSFYTSVFKKDPTLITYNPGINSSDAIIIRNAAKTEVFDNLPLWDYKKLPEAAFDFYAGSGINEIVFHPLNPGIKQTYLWSFGDGDTSSAVFPSHSYSSNGTYIVTLTTTTCDLQGLHTSTFDTIIQFCNHTPTVFTTNPVVCLADTLWTEPADSYQWYVYHQAIPETGQYIVNYPQYANSGFSVLSTVNGCAELSGAYNDSPAWSGYYFDIIGNPCTGDTVSFAVLHINGFLSGAENISWYRNDTLLPAMSGSDTLLITTGGKYECKVVNPLADCPLDTTSYAITYNCSISGINERQQNIWTLFPNPVSQSMTIKFDDYPGRDLIQLFSITGMRIKEVPVTFPATLINVNDLQDGLYFVRLKNRSESVAKFVKM